MGCLTWRIDIQIYDGSPVKQWLKLLCAQGDCCAYASLFFMARNSFTQHTATATLPGCSSAEQACLLKKWNSSSRAAFAFLVAVLPLNLSAKEFCILGPLPCCPSVYILLSPHSDSHLLWCPGTLLSPPGSTHPDFSPLPLHRREQTDFLQMGLLTYFIRLQILWQRINQGDTDSCICSYFCCFSIFGQQPGKYTKEQMLERLLAQISLLF